MIIHSEAPELQKRALTCTGLRFCILGCTQASSLLKTHDTQQIDLQATTLFL